MALVGQEVPDEYGVSTADDSAAIRGEAELGYGLRVADENLPQERERRRERERERLRREAKGEKYYR